MILKDALKMTMFLIKQNYIFDKNLFCHKLIRKNIFQRFKFTRHKTQKLLEWSILLQSFSVKLYIRNDKTRLMLSQSIIQCFFLPSNKPDLSRSCVKFMNCRDWKPMKNSGIGFKHFDEKYFKTGV